MPTRSREENVPSGVRASRRRRDMSTVGKVQRRGWEEDRSGDVRGSVLGRTKDVLEACPVVGGYKDSQLVVVVAVGTRYIEKKEKENVMKNAMALRILQQSVSKTIYPRLFGFKKAKEAWSVLKKEFQGSEKVIAIKLQGLWRDFDNLAMKELEMVKDFFSRVVEIMN
ncbi:hypothetical protein MLD38_021223 [Melastoma candidum]|uniref:Uncharacterized protein n=1 Tax=Melastoma candidum TaxID=119954 RepID=A0ACB9QH87_9MYRT|nr:hypothetical protein MLD38_021223 [Melastoma candidum]